METGFCRLTSYHTHPTRNPCPVTRTHPPHDYSRHVGGLEQGDQGRRWQWGQQSQQDQCIAHQENAACGSGRSGVPVNLSSALASFPRPEFPQEPHPALG